MVFSSMIFLWIFLPIVILLYFIVPKKIKNFILLLASLFFYAWGEPIYIFLMLMSILINWFIGIVIEKKAELKKICLLVAVLINVGILGYYKYSGFLVQIINDVFRKDYPVPDIALPIGISFFTFQILSYVIDLYKGEYKAQKNILNLALYISFFPQLIAGPIVKYKDISEQIENRVVSSDKFVEGIRRFCYGLGKKVLIANTMAASVDTIYALEEGKISGWMALIASVMYTLQIYYDFSGYSDMAIGLGKMFGFDFQENFIYPYMANSIQDFWRRWHISLSSWFKEYVYIPLGGNRKGKEKTYINLIIVFFLTGLWHGAGITFILWGLYHGFFSIIERLGLQKLLSKNNIVSRIYTMVVVNFGWVLFRAETMSQAKMIFKHILLPWRYVNAEVMWPSFITNKSFIFIVLAIIGSGPVQMFFEKTGLNVKLKSTYIEMLYLTGILVLSIAALSSNTYNPFIYFRF